MHVLLIDNGPNAAHRLNHVAASCAARIERADPALALVSVRSTTCDIVVVDLAEAEGCALVRQMRAADINVPVVMLAGQTDPAAMVRALAVGADDVLAKPFDPDELAARLHAVARRGRGISRAMLQAGAIRLDTESQELTVNGRTVPVTEKEFATLELLMLRKGTTLSKEAFLTHLYGGMDEPSAKIVDVFICKLRRKLAQAGAPHAIETVWGHGYTVRDQAAISALT